MSDQVYERTVSPAVEASPSSAAVSHASDAVKCEAVVDGEELDALSLPAKAAGKPRVRRRRLCELSDNEIWRCTHCGKCYSKTSKAAILEHSRSSCQRKIAEDAEIKRQIEQYFTCTQNPNKFHVGMNINLSMQHYPAPGFAGRMNPTAHAAYGNYGYPISQPAAPSTGIGMPIAMGMPMPMLMRSHANVVPSYTQTHPRGLVVNQDAAAQYPAVYDDSGAVYSAYAAHVADVQQLNPAALMYAAPHAQSMYDQVAPAPGPVCVRSSSGRSVSPNQAAQSGANESALSVNQKMSAAQINQMNFITPAHASRSIQPIPTEAVDALPPTAGTTNALATSAAAATVGSNSNCSSPQPPDDSPSSSQPQPKRQRVSVPSLIQQQQYQHPQAPSSYSDYEYTYPRQAFPPRAAGIRHFSCPSASAGGGPMHPSAVQRNVCHFNAPACSDNMLSVHNYRPELSAHATAYTPSSAPANTLNTLSAAANEQSAKHFSLLHSRVGAVGGFSRSTIRPELLHNSAAHW